MLIHCQVTGKLDVLKAGSREQGTFSYRSVEERNRLYMWVQRDGMRPKGKTGRGSEMRWGNSKSGGIIRRWRSN